MEPTPKRQRIGGSAADTVDVAFFGAPASFTERAARLYLERASLAAGALKPRPTHDAVIECVASGEAAYGLLPVESSATGTLRGSYEALLRRCGDGSEGGGAGVRAVGEIICREEPALCVSSGTASTADVARVLSHPAILEQCAAFLGALPGSNVERVATASSSAACAAVAAAPAAARGWAAVATPEAAALHGLAVLETGIGDDANLETRYIVVARCAAGAGGLTAGSTAPTVTIPALGSGAGGGTGPEPRWRASAALAVPNEPGALFKVVACFALRGINIVRFETRPMVSAVDMLAASSSSSSSSSSSNGAGGGGKEKGGLSAVRHWDYVFFVDFEPSRKAETNAALLANLREHAVWLRELGCYEVGLGAAGGANGAGEGAAAAAPAAPPSPIFSPSKWWQKGHLC